MEIKDSPRTKDPFIDGSRWKRREFDRHVESCQKIYRQLQKCKPNDETYSLLLKFGKRLKRDRMLMIYERLKLSLPTVWYLHDNNFDSLTVLFKGKNDCPDLKNPVCFKIYLDAREDMSTLYVRGKFMVRNFVKKNHIFNDYDSLKTVLAGYLLDEMTKKTRKSSIIKVKPRKNSVPDNLGSDRIK